MSHESFAVRRRLLGLFGLPAACALSPAPARAAGSEPKPWPKQSATPVLVLPALDGKVWRLEAAAGSVVLLNFWATWCAPCREELPSLELLAHRHASDGLIVISVNFRQGAGAVARFIESEGLALPVLLDADGAAARAWGARVLPTSVAIDRRGRAAFSVTGEVDWAGAQARVWLAPLLAQPAPTQGPASTGSSSG